MHDFTNSLYIHYILLNLSVLGLCLRINDSALFAWISLIALSRTFLSYYCQTIVIAHYMVRVYLRISNLALAVNTCVASHLPDAYSMNIPGIQCANIINSYYI